MGFARESDPAKPDPPKEQPPRNLSGTPDRAGLIDTLESGRAFEACLTEGVTPSAGESSQVP